MKLGRLLAIIPARGGSKGLPGKNIRPMAGLPLIAHSIRLARLCPEIDRCVVSTDADSIAKVAREHGGDVPFLRPAELAHDTASVWPALRHALATVEGDEGRAYDAVLLLDPTSPTRLPEDVAGACARLAAEPAADGVLSVSRPTFNPIWHCVVERDGWMADLMPEAASFERRQEVPTVYRINGCLYLWRASFLRREPIAWRKGRHLLWEIPESRAVSIDDLDEFEHTELMIRSGRITLPWLDA